MQRMEEAFYYFSLNIIKKDTQTGIKRENITITLIDIFLSNYDNTDRYSIKSLTYTAKYKVKGTYKFYNSNIKNFNEIRSTEFTFVSDTRMGYLLTNFKKLRDN